MRKPTGLSTNPSERLGTFKADLLGAKEMKKRTWAVYVLLLLSGIFIISLSLSPVWALDSAQAAKLKVQALVDRFPAQNTEARQTLASQLMGMGSEGILLVCRLLVPPGTGRSHDRPARSVHLAASAGRVASGETGQTVRARGRKAAQGRRRS